MKIISISFSHNATVGYFSDGVCVNIFHEEKFNNIKNFNGFPEKALKYCLKINNIDHNDIDKIVFFTSEPLPINNIENVSSSTNISKILQFICHSYNYIEYKSGSKKLFHFKNYIFHLSTKKYNLALENYLHKNFSISKNKIVYIDHHLSHALTPIFFYGLNNYKHKIILLTQDGAGNGYSSKIYLFNPKNKKIKLLSATPFFSSLGLLYTEMTSFLGMKPVEHEYKVMGLAAYVSDQKYFKHIYDKLKKIIWMDEKTLQFNSKFSTYEGKLYFKENLSMERFDNCAAAIQKLTEDLLIEQILFTIKKYKIKHIALSGGTFMNVKANQKILELPQIKKIFFQPSCGDESTVIGAATQIFHQNNIELKPINSMFLGHNYTNQKIESFLNKKGIFKKYQTHYFENINDQIAKLLSEFNIVSVFKGPGEWGARSLGNRTILGNASDIKTFYEVNDMIKMRDFWMPFAPVILDCWADKYIKNWNKIKNKAFESTKYMILTMDSTPLAIKHLRAAIHQKDKTLRPQIVTASSNSNLYEILKKYESLTGMGGLLNTSLNIHGYPLVGTLEQAIFTFENSGLKYLALGNWLISKQNI